MKITKTQLKQIIQEELEKALDDRGQASDFFTAPKPGEILSLTLE